MSETLLAALDDASTDKELFDAACAIVAVPKKPGTGEWDSSFILHAPLEMCARYFLLPLVDDDYVADARRQMRMTAKKYDAFANADLAHGYQSLEGFSVAGLDVDQWATSLLFAGHGSILLSFHNALGETNNSIHYILMNMANGIVAGGDARMEWTRTVEPTDDISPELLKRPQQWFVEHVGNIAHVDGPTDSIRAEVEVVEEASVIEPLVDTIAAIARFSERADFELPFQALMRVSALSMIIENEQHSRYGWTHCLTIPHAIWTLAPFSANRGRMLQASTTYVAAFRSLMSNEKMDVNFLAEYYEPDEDSVFAEHYVRITDIISQACTMEDAHLVKYVYSCFDCMKRDPQYSKLYIAAAGKLLALWQEI